MVAGTEITDNFDVLNWFQMQKIKFTMLIQFSTSKLSTFLCIIAHNCRFSIFAGRETRGKVRRAHDCTPLPNLPTPEKLRPTPSTIYPPPS